MWHPIRAFKYRDIGRLDYYRFNVLIRCVSLPLCAIVGLDHKSIFFTRLNYSICLPGRAVHVEGGGGGDAA